MSVEISGMGEQPARRLGEPAADQALEPFLNPVEQNNPSKQAVCEQVVRSSYADLFEQVWGPGSLDCSDAGIDATYDRLGLSIAAYEASSEVNQFSSKYDAWLAGDAELTEQEALGLALFEGEAMCSACHPTGEGSAFTDFTFDNLGGPKNPENPFYRMNKEYLDDGLPVNPEGASWVDPGLGGFLATRPEWAAMADENLGKHKVPTLRNVGKRFGKGATRAFTHNGYFKSLKGVIHFHNTRDVKPVCADPMPTESEALKQDCWPPAEVLDNVNTAEVGNLGLSDAEEDAIVAFMETLSDDFSVKKKRRRKRR